MLTYEQRLKLVGSYQGMLMLITANQDHLEELAGRMHAKSVTPKEALAELDGIVESLGELGNHVGDMISELVILDQHAVDQGEPSAFEQIMSSLAPLLNRLPEGGNVIKLPPRKPPSGS